MKNSRISLKSKTIFILTITLLVTVTSAAVGFYFHEQRQLKKNLEEHLQTTFSFLTAISSDAMITADVTALRSIVDHIVRYDLPLVWIRFENESGEALHEWATQDIKSHLSQATHTWDYKIEGEHFGTIHLAFDDGRMQETIKKHIYKMLSYWIAVFIFFTLVLCLWLYHYFLTPLRKINEYVLEVSQGHHETQFNIHSSQEFSELGSNLLQIIRQGVKAEEEKVEEKVLSETKEKTQDSNAQPMVKTEKVDEEIS